MLLNLYTKSCNRDLVATTPRLLEA
uniref:Uncharacterized protein n=1 Tax=Arundo donax TaxID=35708 RepID=A0A0A8YES3_ARUDO